jgi:hypothetical protein
MTPQDPALERARRRAKELREFYSHLITYLVVCTFLVAIDLANGEPGNPDVFIGLNWAYWPVFGWGAFVVIHAAKTFFGLGGWEERKAQEIYEKEKRRDPLTH